MSGEEARAYGIVDHVIAKRDDLGDGAATEKKDDA
jgi:ATP-dependent protease ClpP protease subunit